MNWLKSENHRTLEGVWGDNSLTRLEKKILEGIHKRNKSFRVDGPSRTDLYFLQKCYQGKLIVLDSPFGSLYYFSCPFMRNGRSLEVT